MQYGKWRVYDLLLPVIFAATVTMAVPIHPLIVSAVIVFDALMLYTYLYLANREIDMLYGREIYTGCQAVREYCMFRVWHILIIAVLIVLAFRFPSSGFGRTHNIMATVRFWITLLILAPCTQLWAVRGEAAQLRRELEIKKRLEE